LQFPFKQFGLYIDLGGKKQQMVREKNVERWNLMKSWIYQNSPDFTDFIRFHWFVYVFGFGVQCVFSWFCWNKLGYICLVINSIFFSKCNVWNKLYDYLLLIQKGQPPQLAQGNPKQSSSKGAVFR
jgi:hypothetical protein